MSEEEKKYQPQEPSENWPEEKWRAYFEIYNPTAEQSANLIKNLIKCGGEIYAHLVNSGSILSESMTRIVLILPQATRNARAFLEIRESEWKKICWSCYRKNNNEN